MRKRPKITEFRFDQYVRDLRNYIQESVSPFENDSPEKQKARVERARHDKLYFMREYLPHYFSSPFGDFHEEWADLADLEDEVVLVAAPREHAKSTFFTFGDSLHKICFSLRHFIIILSDTNDQASTFTVGIGLELEENPRLKHDFGKLLGPVWNKSSFITTNGIWVLARGHQDKVRGLRNRQHRPDHVVVDDFENDINVRNPKNIKAGIDLLQGTVIGSMGKGYTFLMVGNLFHPKSVLSQLIAMKDEDGKPLYVSRIYQAIVDEGTPNERPLWSGGWSLARLQAKRRKMGTVNFNREMMNLCGAEDSPFPESWFKFHTAQEIADILPELQVVSSCDPSAKQGEANDLKAIVAVGWDAKQGIYRCLHAWLRHASPGAMLDAAYQISDTYGGPMGIEDNMLEDFLHEAIQNYAQKVGRYISWVPVHHGTNKEVRIITTLSYLVEYGKITFEKGHSDQDRLREQLVYILNKNVNDDGPDALETAVSLLQKYSFVPVDVSADPGFDTYRSGRAGGFRAMFSRMH
ncbi:MAG: hypothetical protein ACYC6G_14130 [Desulfobaccales bacterium]